MPARPFPRLRRAALALVAAPLPLLAPARADAQPACAVGTADDYFALALASASCRIGGVGVQWTQFSNADRGIAVTPVSGSDAFGSYFGFRLSRPTGGPLFAAALDASSATPNAADALEHAGVLNGLFWKFAHDLSPTAVTRTALTTTGAAVAAQSQQVVAPAMVAYHDPASGDYLGDNPDPSTGCGWEMTGADGASYAGRTCGYLRGHTNNWIWNLTDGASANAFDYIAWSTSTAGGSEYDPTDAVDHSCWYQSTLMPYVGGTCASYQNLAVGMGNVAEGGTYAEALAMPDATWNPNPGPQTGWIDPTADPASLFASASVDSYEARLYYTSSVPEPSTVALLGGGLLALAGHGARRRRG